MTTYTDLPQNKAELMKWVNHEWAELVRIIEPLTDDQMNRLGANGWSIKDNLAHITEWEKFMLLSCFQNIPAHQIVGVDKEGYQQDDEHAWNETFLQRNRDRLLVDVLADFHATHEQVLVELDQASFTDLQEKIYFDDPEARSLLCWVRYNTYDHYQEHRITIEKFIKHMLGAKNFS